MAASGDVWDTGVSRHTGVNAIGTSIIQIGHTRPLQRGVHFRISPLNPGTIYIGFSEDLAELGVSKGFALFYFPVVGGSGYGEIDIPVDNMNKLFFKASSSGQILSWISI